MTDSVSDVCGQTLNDSDDMSLDECLVPSEDQCEIVNRIRKAKDNSEAALMRRSLLPEICISATITSRIRGISEERRIINYNSVVVLDVEDVQDADGAKQLLSTLPFVYYAGLNTFGTGLDVIIPVETKQWSEHGKYFHAAKAAVETLGLNVGTNGESAASTIYQSFDPNPYRNINSLLDALVPTNALKKGIKDKLAVICDATSVADYVDRRSNAAAVQALTQAAREKKKVLLKGYESGNSHTIRDRYVEPYGFTTDYIDVCAYDLEDRQNKIFKIQRIGEVEVLDEPWTDEKSHHKQGMDVFRMTGRYNGHLKWQMTVMAKNLLLEEYPLAQKELKRKGNFWILDTDICNYAGACRFYVGLADQIKIIDSPEFVAYVKDYLYKNLSKL